MNKININIFLLFCFLFRHDMNSMVTQKNSSIAYLTDNNNNNTQTDEIFNFSLIHASTTIKLNQLEYDDNVDIDD